MRNVVESNDGKVRNVVGRNDKNCIGERMGRKVRNVVGRNEKNCIGERMGRVMRRVVERTNEWSNRGS